MHRLARTVRLSLPGPSGGGNGFGGRPATETLAPFVEVTVECVGEPDQRTGYLINIKEIDDAVLAAAPAVLEPGGSPASAARAMLGRVSSALPVRVERLSLRPTPYLEWEARMNGPVVVRPRFEFSASHRLHVASISDDENRRIFGKCNNPAGHGHNYRVEPAIRVDPARPVAVGRIEEIVDEIVIERFDHKHLNDQTVEFGPDGVNPSVEHIARVCFDLLEGPIGVAGGRLMAVTVWETDRTSCTYPA